VSRALVNPARGQSADSAWGAKLEITRAVLNRRMPATAPLWARVLTTLAIAAGAVLVAVSAVIHLHLWSQGYKHIHIIGPLFLAQAIGGIALALVMLGIRRLMTVLAGVLYMASTALGLMLSDWVGLFGFRDTLQVPWATTSLVVELVGLAVLAVAGVVLAAQR
jgi:hypothetical protein